MKKVFLCWSGPRSGHVARALYKWLPDVLQNVDPWMSAESIAAGARWSREVEDRLEATDFGILCITPENSGAPWIHFEAGALSKRVDASRVVPYLIGMRESAEVPEGPLTRFQAKLALTETFDVLKSLNDAMGQEGLTADRLDRAYKRCWPDLEAALRSAPAPATAPNPPDTSAMLSEIVETVRDLARRSAPPTRQVVTDFAPRNPQLWVAFSEFVNAQPKMQEAGARIEFFQVLDDGKIRVDVVGQRSRTRLITGWSDMSLEQIVATVLSVAKAHDARPRPSGEAETPPLNENLSLKA